MIMHTNVMKHSLILMLLAGAACVGSAGSAAAPAPGRVYAYAAPTAADGAARARDLLAAVAKHMRTLGSYDLRFVVETEEGATEGSCSVSGDDYVMRLGRAEIYGSPAVRYEVDNVRREVTVESNDGSRTDILSNPARAFDLAGEAFDALLVLESGGEAVVRLTPRAGQRGLSALTLTLDAAKSEPLVLEYDFDGDRIRIRLQGVAARKSPLPRFDRARYADYEVIDFR